MALFYLLVLVMGMPNHPLFEMPFAGLTVIKYMGIACLAYTCFYLLSSNRVPRFFQTGQARLFMVLLTMAFLSVMFKGEAQGLAFSPLGMYISFFFFFLITVALVDSLRRLRMALLCSVGAMTLASLYVIREFQKSGGAETRPGWIAGDSNYFALCCLLVLPLAFYFLRLKGPRWERWLCGVSLLIMLLAFTLASSRGGLLGLSVGTLLILARSKRRMRDALIVAIAVLPLMIFAPSSPVKRLLHPTISEEGAVDIREGYWRAGLKMIRTYPLAGVGLGKFAYALDAYADSSLDSRGLAHNTYIEYAAELGIPALGTYLALIGAMLWSLEKIRRRARRIGHSLMAYAAEATQAGILSYAIAAFFISAEYQKAFWFFLAISACLPDLMRQTELASDHARPIEEKEVIHRVAAAPVSVPIPREEITSLFGQQFLSHARSLAAMRGQRT